VVALDQRGHGASEWDLHGRYSIDDFVADAHEVSQQLGHAPPVQRGLTAAMRAQAQELGDLDRMQAWAGQSAALGPSLPAADLARYLWDGAQALLGWGVTYKDGGVHVTSYGEVLDGRLKGAWIYVNQSLRCMGNPFAAHMWRFKL
jgi:hypothetical protein